MAEVAIVMGSQSDFETMKAASTVLEEMQIATKMIIISAHRTPERLYNFAKSASDHGIKVIIAGAGGSAHLPGMIASMTMLPVIGVPIKSKTLNGIDSLLSIVQMPKGVPVATMAIGIDGSVNAAIMAASILALNDQKLSSVLTAWRKRCSDKVSEDPLV